AVEEGGPSYSEAQQPSEPAPGQAEMMQRMMGNFDFFLGHEIRPIGGYVPDFAALNASPSRVVVGGGKTSGEQGAYRAAAALAERLGIDVTYFEGAHGGFGAPEEAFADLVDQILRGDS
ncbi:MAG: alpha/beta hydrolase, partial [Actinomycetota bacterium]